ncbi:exodeoxyribonuclease VII small subunit [Chitinispirillales bacterium ANBcel5]|uniref:exodeoxyribonuclease VII small subunit n=1 Tax=Cellulosispirillum alkaliphilum TaxID=3039283 RepID=UPI002A4EA273|nr:exodeoxyribonuclease VII small subunit [Chitinispirillales bacterium ANBcel5]
MKEKNKINRSFEEALCELESVIEQLEREDLTLDKALEHFENGISLMRHCDSHLKNAQGKLKELLKDENGKWVTKVSGVTLQSFIEGEEVDG